MSDAGVRIEINAADLAAAGARIARLADLNTAALVEEIVALGESQTRRRIEAGGPGPDGTAWKPNRDRTPILLRSGRHLRDSLASRASADGGEWGAAWEFAHVHQFGATIVPKNAQFLAFKSGGKRIFARKVHIPARPFLGVSGADAADIRHLVTDFLRRAA